MHKYIYLVSYCENYKLEDKIKYYLFNFHGAYKGRYIRGVKLKVAANLEMPIDLREDYVILAREEKIQFSYLYAQILKIKRVQDYSL